MFLRTVFRLNKQCQATVTRKYRRVVISKEVNIDRPNCSTIATAAGKSLLVANNYLYNDDTAAASNGIDLNVAFTGMIVGNTIFSLYATACATIIDPGSCGMSQNFISNKIDQYSISTAVGAAST